MSRSGRDSRLADTLKQHGVDRDRSEAEACETTWCSGSLGDDAWATPVTLWEAGHLTLTALRSARCCSLLWCVGNGHGHGSWPRRLWIERVVVNVYRQRVREDQPGPRRRPFGNDSKQRFRPRSTQQGIARAAAIGRHPRSSGTQAQQDRVFAGEALGNLEGAGASREGEDSDGRHIPPARYELR